jgi:peptidylprolyl isomerase
MKKSMYFLMLALAIISSSCKDEHKNLKDGLYAEIETSRGNIIVALDYKKTPITVANFVSLAAGKNQFVTDDLKGKPFYDDLQFHRVIADFMIQTGDPIGTGSGDAGYKFVDEITDLKHDKPGILSMANSGPKTNSSQFFITHVATPWLDGKHTVFGHVVEGMDIVNTITQGDLMKKITIIRKGEEVKKFDAVKVFSDYFKNEIENQKKQAAIDAQQQKEYDAKYKIVKDQKVAYFNQLMKSATKTASGFKFNILQKSNGKKPQDGETIAIEYAGYLEDGTLFDTSSAEIAKQFGKFDEQRAMQNGYTALPYVMGSNQLIPGFVEGINKLKMGEKAVFFIPFNLGYGEQGAGNVIPANANLIFEVTIVK